MSKPSKKYYFSRDFKDICLVIAAFCLGLALASCAPRPRTQIQRSPLDTTVDFGGSYLKSSCAMGFEEGSNEPISPAASDIRPSFFGKIFDFSRPAAIGEASMKSLADFMIKEGVIPYSLPYVAQGACAPLKQLNPASTELREFWEDNAAASALAIYLPRDQVEFYGERTAVILTRADSDRYTLMHEYLHHVFNSLRERNGLIVSSLYEKFDITSEAYGKVGPLDKESEKNKQKVSAYLKAWTEFAEVKVDLFLATALEEMSIEAILQDFEKQGKIGPITEFNRSNSVGYIASNDQSIREEVKKMVRTTESNKKLATQHSLTDWLERSQKLNQKVQNILNEMNQILATHGERSPYFHSLKIMGLVDPETPHTTIPCAHTIRFLGKLNQHKKSQTDLTHSH